ncbi:ATP-binding protein [Campylobacter curvus]|uniref:ATP-binding protein n=1 Tax=Campylobacter curvus TaxID=200 RepID=UPI0003824840|nr:DUF87 domain-containing protein [Campylobacter curvus]QKF61795.1 YjgR domain-containing protein [Campylobacter curvus]UEB50088.1 DUF87 domain-containing protein [Campylobacter curvus]
MKSIQENLKLFYIGLKDKEPFFYKNKDLTTHAAIIGMTGSGKTGLGITLLEEACIDNIPSIIIDPKGDMTNLALTFPDMSADDFRPYIDENEAANKGLSVDECAKKESEIWREGIEASYQNLERVKLLKDSVDLTIYTPKSSAGVGVALLSDFARPNLSDEESFSNYINSLAASVLSLIGINDEDMSSKEQLLVASIFDAKFKEGRDVTLEELIGFIANPPFKKIGVFDVDTFYPGDQRMKLAMKINTLIASPSFKGWSEGVKLDISKMLFDENGKAKCNIFTISHLSNSERMFFVTLLLNEIIAWMRTTEGTSSLRAILYMDEIFGFFPPNGNPPSKTPMLTLLKQARAFGIGCVLSTQNPVDLDYKGLSNIGTWFIGRLQTAQDKARVIDGLTGISGSAANKAQLENMISNLAKRSFLLKNINEDGLNIIGTRWALSYLKGPLSHEQISNLMREKKDGLQAIKAKKADLKSAPKPILSNEIEQIYSAQASEILTPNLLATAKVRFYDTKKGIDAVKQISYIYALDENDKSADWTQASEDTELNLRTDAKEDASYEILPGFVANAKNFNDIKRDFKEFVFRNYKLEIFEAMGISSKPTEDKEQFFVRLQDRCNEILEEKTAELTAKFEKEKAKLEEKLNKALVKLDKEQKDMTASGLDVAINIGASIIGALFGNKLLSRSNATKIASSARSANRVLKERSDVKLSEQSVNEINAQIDELTGSFEQQAQALKEANDIKNITLNEVQISPKKSDIYDEKVVLLWR